MGISGLSAVDSRTPMSSVMNASNLFNGGFAALQRVLDDQRKRYDFQYDQDVKANDQAIQSAFNDYTTLKAFKDADKGGVFNADAWSRKFGNKFTPSIADAARNAALARLQENAYNASVGVGMDASNAAYDTTKGSQAITQELIRRGMDPALAMQKGNEWNKNAAYMQEGYAQDRRVNSQDFLDTVRSSGNLPTSQAEITKLVAGLEGNYDKESISRQLSSGLSGRRAERREDIATQDANVRRAREAARYRREMQKLTPDQQREYDYLYQTGQARIKSQNDVALQNLSGLQTTINQTPDAIEPEVANKLKDVTDPASSIQEIFKKEIDSKFYHGLINGVANLFGNVTTGTDAMDVVNKKLQDLQKAGYSDHDAAALMLQSYKSTFAKHDTGVGMGINVKAWEDEIEERGALLKNKRALQSQYVEAQNQAQGQIAEAEQALRDTLHSYTSNRSNPNWQPAAFQPSANAPIIQSGSPSKSSNPVAELAARAGIDVSGLNTKPDDVKQQTVAEKPATAFNRVTRPASMQQSAAMGNLNGAVAKQNEQAAAVKTLLDSISKGPATRKGPRGQTEIVNEFTPSLATSIQQWAGQTQTGNTRKIGESNLAAAIRKTGAYGESLQKMKTMANRLRKRFPDSDEEDLIRMVQQLKKFQDK